MCKKKKKKKKERKEMKLFLILFVPIVESNSDKGFQQQVKFLPTRAPVHHPCNPCYLGG
jgi:hypothetical protein